MKKVIFVFILFAITLGNLANAQLTPKFGNDILIDTVAGKVYSNVRIATAYDGTIYYARLVADSKTDWPRGWEIYKSTDGGVSFNLFKSDAFQATSIRRIACMDICAAGENDTDFRLYFSAPSTDTVAHAGYMNAVCYDKDGNRTILPINGEINNYMANIDKKYQLGFNSVSWATDSKKPSIYSTPYTITLTTSKQSGSSSLSVNDSLILYSSNGGTTFQRKGLYASTRMSEIASSIGVGRRFDGSNFVNDQPVLGYIFCSALKIRVGFIYTLDFTVIPTTASQAVTNTSQALSTLTPGRIYSPSIALSQTNDNSKSGIGYDDLRCFVAFNYRDTLCISYRDSLITGNRAVPNSFYAKVEKYKNGPVNGTLHYDTYSDNFLLTYYDREKQTLPYLSKKLNDPGFEFTMIDSSYRDITDIPPAYIKPQLTVRPTFGTHPFSTIFGWQDGNATFFDTEDAVVVATQRMNNLTPIKVYPNPTNGMVNIFSESTLAQVQVLNLAGQEVTSSTPIFGNQVDMTSLNQGIYFLQVIDERGNMNTIKVIKE